MISNLHAWRSQCCVRFYGSFGSMIAPTADSAASDKHQKITFYIYAGLTVALGFFICHLRKTQNRSFDDGEERTDATQIDNAMETKL